MARTRPVVHLIPHTHWDREWYLPAGGHRGRLVVAIEQLLQRLEDPRLTGFLLDGQTVLVEDLLTVRPELQARIADLVRAGRIDTGPWYVLADEQIPAGESLLRNLALGRADATGLGRSCATLYSPDAFGHPAVLPSLGREFGLTRAVVWRGLGIEATGGRDLCWWEAPDGRRVLVYHLPPDGYEIGSNLLVAPELLAAAWARVSAAIMPRAATRQVALFVGADHHAPAPDLPGLAERLAVLDPGTEFRFSGLDAFFDAAMAEVGDLVVVRGELRWSYGYTWTLQGVHASRAQLKRRNSDLELHFTRTVEPLLAVSGSSAGEQAILRRGWREVIQGHFHDALGGCCADAVARAVETRFDDAESASADLVLAAQNRLAGHDPDRVREGAPSRPRLLVWNGAARPRGGVIVAEATFFRRDVLVGPPGGRKPGQGPGFTPFALQAVGGSHLPVAPQLLSVEPALDRRDAVRHYPDQDIVDRAWFAFPLAEAVPGLGTRLFEPVASAAEPGEAFAAASRRTLFNGRLVATVEPGGTVQLAGTGAGPRFAGLLALESERDQGDCYSFAPLRGDRIARPGRGGRTGITAEGPLAAGIEWTRRLACGVGSRAGRAGAVAVRLSLSLIGDSPILRCELLLDNQARDHRLRLRLPLGLRGVPALAGAQFGSVARPPVTVRGRFPAERPVATAPAHRWVAVAKGARGLALLAPGFFEYEWTGRGDLLLTLLRAVGQLSLPDLATRPGNAGWPMATPMAQCQGMERMTLGLALVTESELAAPERLEELWEDCFVPPVTRWIRDCAIDQPAPGSPSVSLEGEGLVFSAALPEDDGLVLRCFNARPAPVPGRWRLDRPVARATRIRADGSPVAELVVDDDGSTVSFTAGPAELVTVRLTLPRRTVAAR